MIGLSVVIVSKSRHIAGSQEVLMGDAMPRRTLGRNGFMVSAVGLGCMGMSEFYGPSEQATNRAVLNHALDIGVNSLDTAVARSRRWD